CQGVLSQRRIVASASVLEQSGTATSGISLGHGEVAGGGPHNSVQVVITQEWPVSELDHPGASIGGLGQDQIPIDLLIAGKVISAVQLGEIASVSRRTLRALRSCRTDWALWPRDPSQSNW